MRKLMNGFLFVALLSFKTNGQQMRSNWQEQLKPCEVEIPLHYATKNQSKLIEAAEKYRGVELILVTIDKKMYVVQKIKGVKREIFPGETKEVIAYSSNLMGFFSDFSLTKYQMISG